MDRRDARFMAARQGQPGLVCRGSQVLFVFPAGFFAAEAASGEDQLWDGTSDCPIPLQLPRAWKHERSDHRTSNVSSILRPCGSLRKT
jgi:hypothetical protein